MSPAMRGGVQTEKLLPAPPLTPHRRSGAVVVLSLALLARLLPFFSLLRQSKATWIFGRGLETGFVAHALLRGRGFASPFGGDTGSTALISPGYTLLVTAIFRLFGDASIASAVVILLAQIALGVLTVWIVMRLTAHLAGGRAALLAGTFFALWPPLWWVPTIFWDTSLTLCIVPVLVLLTLRLRQRPGAALWLGFGALSGFAILVNLALPPTVFALFAWLFFTAKSSRRSLALAGILALVIYMPWPIRNARALHAFIPLRTTVGLELWMGNREGAKGFVDESVFPFFNRAEFASYVQMGEVAYMHQKSVAASAHISQYPVTFLALSAKRFLRFWFGAGTQNGPTLYVLGATFTTVCGLLGLRRLFREHQRATAVLFALPFLLYPLPYYITHAEFRYRLALDPLLTALSACLLARKSTEGGHGGVPASPRKAEPPVVHA